MTGKRGPAEWRFWNHVDKHGPIPEKRPDLGPCWLWTGALYSVGYGQWRAYHGGLSGPAHRYAYELEHGPIPEGLECDHLCQNKRCIRPSHLEPVTHAENQRRTRRPLCRRGHPLTDENTYTHIDRKNLPHRRCRICMAIQQVLYRERWGGRKPARAA